MIFMDFETRGEIDLTRLGGYRDGQHGTTEILVIGWMDTLDDQARLILGKHFEGLHSFDSQELILDVDYAEGRNLEQRIADGETVVVFNYQFETLGYMHCLEELYGWTTLAPLQVQDVAAMARSMALPGNLDTLAQCIFMSLGLPPQGKDREGRQIMLRFCKPGHNGRYFWDDNDYKQLGQYCKRDVELTRLLYDILDPLSEDEQWQMVNTERMNARGVRLDVHLAELLVAMADEEKADIDERLHKITRGVVQGATKVKQIKEWLALATGDDFPTIGVDVLRETLEKLDDVNDSLTMKLSLAYPGGASSKLRDLVREVIELRLLGAKTSVAKIAKMIDAADPYDHRIRGMFLFCGAGKTGRWSSKLVQLHNLPKAGYGKNTENVVEMVESHGAEGLRLMYGNVMNELPKLIRTLLIAEDDKQFIGGDFAGIEARILAWLAKEESKLEMYRNDEDTYLQAAKDVGYEGQRQVGKTAELALGYGGASGALSSMAAKFNVKIPIEKQDAIVTDWRKANPFIVEFWFDVIKAAKKAMRTSKTFFKVRADLDLSYYYDDFHLWCKLPSGRMLCNPFVELDAVSGPSGDELQITAVKGGSKPKQGATEWPVVRLWHGILVENICQALSGDLLRWALKQLDTARFDVVLHVHDEFVSEVDLDVAIADVAECLATLPTWCKDLPFKIEFWSGSRYRK